MRNERLDSHLWGPLRLVDVIPQQGFFETREEQLQGQESAMQSLVISLHTCYELLFATSADVQLAATAEHSLAFSLL